MSQHDLDIANQTGSLFRSDINNALKALGSLSSGTVDPSLSIGSGGVGATQPYQLWADTASGYLKQRNAANNAWVVLCKLGSFLMNEGGEASVAIAANMTTLGSAPFTKCSMYGSAGTVITSFGTSPNRIKFVRIIDEAGPTTSYCYLQYSSALQFAHDVEYGGNKYLQLTTGDSFIATSDNSGNWTISNVYKANGDIKVGTRQCILDAPQPNYALEENGNETDFLAVSGNHVVLGKQGGATTANISATNPLILTCAAGYSGVGKSIDYVATITDASDFNSTVASGWNNIASAGNGTYYLWVDINPITSKPASTGFTTKNPIYSQNEGLVWGNGNGASTDATTKADKQFTFLINRQLGIAGNGTQATQVYRVFVGHATVNAGSITILVSYGMFKTRNYIVSGIPTSTSYGASYNPQGADTVKVRLYCKTAELGYSIGDTVDLAAMGGWVFRLDKTAGTLYIVAPGASLTNSIRRADTGALGTPTYANWDTYITISRSW